MGYKEEKYETLSFHVHLLLQMSELKNYPFRCMIVQKGISQQEYSELMSQIDKINNIYLDQKESGMLDFTSLLIEFAGMLNEKLHPDETIKAMIIEGVYTDLMNEFKLIIERESC